MTTPLVARMREFGTTIFAEMSALAASDRGDQPGPGLSRHRRAAGDARGGPGGDRERAQPVPARPGHPRAASTPSPRTRRASTAYSSTPTREVLVTVGATEAIAATVLALCEPGDEVVDLRALLRLVCRHHRPRGRRAPHVGAPVPRLRRGRGLAAGRLLHADPDGAPQQPAQPHRQGLHPGRARARLRAGAQA